MDALLICQICGEKLSFNPECPCTLGEHLIRKHPNVEMTHFSKEDLYCCCDSSSRKLPTCPRTGLSCSCVSFEQPEKKTLPKCIFKTTVETWKPGPLRVMCPACGNLARPCIRRQRNRVAYTSLGALCLLVCWPVCFLPFLMPESSQIQLFCKKCGAFLGRWVCRECWPEPGLRGERVQHLTHEVGGLRPPKPKCVICHRPCYLVMTRYNCVMCRNR